MVVLFQEERSDVIYDITTTFRELNPYSSYRLEVISWFASPVFLKQIVRESKDATVVNVMTLEDGKM